VTAASGDPLEVLRGLGLAAERIERGNDAVWVQLHAGGRVVRVRLFGLGLDDTAYPFLLFLPPTLAKRIATVQPPRLRGDPSYLRADGHRTRVVVGDNNVGLVLVRPPDGVVVHRLLARRGGRTIPHTTSFPVQSGAHLPTAQ
jgi:hypothetical protein